MNEGEPGKSNRERHECVQAESDKGDKDPGTSTGSNERKDGEAGKGIDENRADKKR